MLLALMLLALMLGSLISTLAIGQGPPVLDGTSGERRPGANSVFDPPSPAQPEMPVDAFMFLSEAGSKVVVPGTTWEKLEKLKRLEAGDQTDQRAYVFQSLDLSGTVAGNRAELDVTLKLNLESTDRRYIEIPIGMANFHRLDLPVITGVADSVMAVSDRGDGYVLWLRSEQPAQVTVRMNASARVETTPTGSLRLQLPVAPTRLQLDVPQDDLLAEVVSGASDVVQTQSIAEDATRIQVESSGGNSLLRWTSGQVHEVNKPLLEVESRMEVRWDSPQDPPTASIRLTARSVKGPIERFELEMPAGALLLDSPRLGVGGQTVKFGPVDRKGNTNPPLQRSQPGSPMAAGSPTPAEDKSRQSSGTVPNASSTDADDLPQASASSRFERFEVVVPETERQQRIDLSFELQLPANQLTAQSPLVLTTPRIVDSLRHRGVLSIELGGDYRLRWKSGPWVRSQSVLQPEPISSGRLYQFEFDRASFELPVWLSTQEQRLVLMAKSKATIRGEIATLEMLVNVQGAAAGDRLILEDAAWDILSILDPDNEQTFETFLTGGQRVIQWDSSGRQDSLDLRIAAQRSLGQRLGKIEFSLPRLYADESQKVAGESTFQLESSGRTLMTVDLQASEGVTRIADSDATSGLGDGVSRYRLASVGQPIKVAGVLQNQPPRISLTADAAVQLDGPRISTTVQWQLQSATDLEGRLPIRIPQVGIANLLDDDPLLGNETIRDLLPSLFDKTPLDQTTGSNRPSISTTPVDAVAGDSPISNQQIGDQQIQAWSVSVNNVPAILRPLGKDRFDLVSDQLSSGQMQVRWHRDQEVVFGPRPRNVQLLVFPRPRMVDVLLRGNFEIDLQGDGDFELSGPASANDPSAVAGQESFNSESAGGGTAKSAVPSPTPLSSRSMTRRMVREQLPREAVPVRIKRRSVLAEELTLQQLVIRSIVGNQTRKEQILAKVLRGSELRIQVENSGEVKARASVDGEAVAVESDDGWLVVQLPGDQRQHRLEVDLWIPRTAAGSPRHVRPLVKFPTAVGRAFWQVVAPRDSHVVWASPTVGRAMVWRFDRWRLFRQPSLDDQALASLVGTKAGPSEPGNRYLYVGTDFPAFQVVLVSRTLLWILVATTVLCTSILILNVPATRHPMTAIIYAILFAGLIIIAPDAAVLAGQVGMVSLVLVLVMLSIRSLLVPKSSDRVFAGSGQPSGEASLPKTVEVAVMNRDAASASSDASRDLGVDGQLLGTTRTKPSNVATGSSLSRAKVSP